MLNELFCTKKSTMFDMSAMNNNLINRAWILNLYPLVEFLFFVLL